MHPIDEKRLAHGFPPIYVDPARPMTDEERKDRPDHVIRDAAGRAVQHWVPMVRDGFAFYVNVLAVQR